MSFTKIEDEIRYSPAARALSAGARDTLTDFLRLWNRRTHGGKKPVSAIRFVWHEDCPWMVQESAWRGYRSELVAAGFLEVVQLKAGRFALSDRWRAWKPDAATAARLQRVEAARAKRRSRNKTRTRAALPCSENRCTPPPKAEKRVAKIAACVQRKPLQDGRSVQRKPRGSIDIDIKTIEGEGVGIWIHWKDGTRARYTDQDAARDAWRERHGAPISFEAANGWNPKYSAALRAAYERFEAKIAGLPEHPPVSRPDGPARALEQAEVSAASGDTMGLVAAALAVLGVSGDELTRAVHSAVATAAARAVVVEALQSLLEDGSLQAALAPRALVGRFAYRVRTPRDAWFRPKGGAERPPARP